VRAAGAFEQHFLDGLRDLRCVGRADPIRILPLGLAVQGGVVLDQGFVTVLRQPMGYGARHVRFELSGLLVDQGLQHLHRIAVA